jgi:alpha-glucosidase
MGISDYKWWQVGVVYHLYPRSFQDSNGDGVGDLPGITSRLDHLKTLGVEAVWVSPIYPSPMADFGYDVSDHTGIDPVFGSLEDFDALVTEVHARGMKLILDLVPNHTSSAHPWFQESRSSRDNPKRDWYLWADGRDEGEPPNNWLAHFGGSAWTRDDATGQFYYHAFLPDQPDLNWRNPAVRQTIYDVMRTWLRRGVDGFRVDVLWHLLKDDQLRDNPQNPHPHPRHGPSKVLLPLYTADRPGIHDIVREMRNVVDEFPDRVLVGEIYLPVERLVTYYGPHNDLCHLPFNFQLLRLPWDAETVAHAVERYESALPRGAWPNWVLGNHDHHRVASRIGAAQARVAAMLLLTLRGTPTLYYGDEIGMQDVPIPRSRVQDPYEKNVPGQGLGRDPARTPMQWDGSPHGGFTTGKPWLPVSHDVRTVNVETQRADRRSMFSLHKRLIELRRAEPALTIGSWEPMLLQGDALGYIRRHETRRLAVLLNMRHMPTVVSSSRLVGRVVVSTHMDRTEELVRGDIKLRPNEGVIVAM